MPRKPDGTAMTDKISMYATTPSTVHSWLARTPNRTFSSLRKAIEYAGEHADELRALEVFVHTTGEPELIIWGEELASLIKQLRPCPSDPCGSINYDCQS